MTKSMGFALTKLTMPSMSVALMSTHSAIPAMPPFPGAQYSLSTRDDFLSAQQMACSRPPPQLQERS
jgi:hypothetical protein